MRILGALCLGPLYLGPLYLGQLYLGPLDFRHPTGYTWLGFRFA